ncbi:MAG: ABC transporter permease [bacterium]|nr:ABC transporter permease [bacterium]
MLLSIAWKNIWRNKLRSLIVIIAATLGLIGGVLSAGIYSGAAKQSVNDAINSYLSDIQIHHPKFSDNSEAKFFIHNSKQLEEFISSIDGVQSISTRIKFLGMASSPLAAEGVYINGIDIENEKKVTNIYELIPDTMGNYFSDNKKNTVIISRKIAEKLKLKLRSKIVLSFPQKNGTFTGAAFRVTGIFKTYNSGFDQTNVFVRKTDLARISQYSENISHESAVRISPKANIDSIKQKIADHYPDLKIQKWTEVQAQMAMVSEMSDTMIFVFLIIILLALGFGIINTMLMVILERIKEIGMLMAIGMNKLRVFKMIMFETIFLTSVGGFIGMIISAIMLKYFGEKGMSFESVSEGFEKFGYASVIYPSLDTQFYFVLSFLIILTGILASVYPAIKALKLNPVEALKTDI